jgi:hypothetical protein
MLEGMTNPEVTSWMSRLDEIHALLAAPAREQGDAAEADAIERARSAIAELHTEMLRVEVRAVIGGRAASGRRG